MSWRKATRCEEQPQEGKTSVIFNSVSKTTRRSKRKERVSSSSSFSFHREFKKGWMNEEGEETNSLRDVTNDFPVMGDLVMRTGIWDRQRTIITSRYKEM